MVKDIEVTGDIKLDQFLKWSRAVSSGGQGKQFILSDMVKVNGIVENRRSRVLRNGDVVQVVSAGDFRVVTR